MSAKGEKLPPGVDFNGRFIYYVKRNELDTHCAAKRLRNAEGVQ
jgi:hypothetical protein